MLFEIQSTDWNSHHDLDSQQMAEQLEMLCRLGVRHTGYYPDKLLQPLELAELVEEQLALYSDALALSKQQVERQLEGAVRVQGRANLLHQLVRNLLDNAHRYSPPGSVIGVRLSRHGRLACLEVSDQGAGIPEEQLPRVFDRFWRASQDRSDGGSGMGLAIAARICRAHGGSICVDSAMGSGSRFVVELPLA